MNITLAIKDIINHLKTKTMQFVKFKPTSKRGGRNLNQNCPVFISAFGKSSKRASERYVLNFKQFLRENKFGWKNISVGTLDNEVFFCEGDSTDYVVSKHNNEIANKILITTLLDFYNTRKPMGADGIRINFSYIKIDNMYKLVKL
jgi:hypothetical protein